MAESGGKTEVHLSPEVRGVVTMEGMAVEGARVYRTLDYGREYFQETETDARGAFHFSERTIMSGRPGRLLDETRVRQVIGVLHNDDKYLLWYHTPGGITERSAVSRRLNAMRCELTVPEQELLFQNIEKPGFPHAAFSICRWDNGLEMDSLEDVE